MALAAPALFVSMAMAASASENPAADTHHHSHGMVVSPPGGEKWHATHGNGSRGHDTITWYRARTADAGALGAHTSTADALAYGSYDHGWRAGREQQDHGRQAVGRSERPSPRTVGAAESTEHRSGTRLSTAAYHQNAAQANALGASTSATSAAVGERGDYWYAWVDQSAASASAWGADADRTITWTDGATVGHSSSLAYAGPGGAWAGDTDSAAAYGH
jgi:hypothetical protein